MYVMDILNWSAIMKVADIRNNLADAINRVVYTKERIILERRGKKKWRETVLDVVERLFLALEPDYIVLGGGNAKKLDELPEYVRLGDNRAAFTGAFRLWDES